LLSELLIFKKHCFGVVKLNDELKRNQVLRLELGGGERKLPGWIGLDLNDSSAFQIDLSKHIPVPDNRVEAIYSSHLLEHFSFPHPLVDLLEECYRILKPGGFFSVAVPNGGKYISSYCTGKEIIDSRIKANIPDIYLKTRIDEISWFVYMYGQHHYLFNEENLVGLLIDAGFGNVSVRDYDPEFDLEIRRAESLYVIAYKPLE
jgi:predicted SAM-dependent methyltransferase